MDKNKIKTEIENFSINNKFPSDFFNTILWEANQYQNIAKHCEKYDIPINFLGEIMNDPKVIPMIRGKAFEFSAMLKLQQILPEADWIVDKPFMNPQFGLHDMDVRVVHRKTNKIIGIECKLASKGEFKIEKNGDYRLKVKCMRSRTLGEAKAKEMAVKNNLPQIMYEVHNDQYRSNDFTVVLTTIANAFYETDEETDFYEWKPPVKATPFFEQILSGEMENGEELIQNRIFNKMYLAKSESLTVGTSNGVKCGRKLCPTPESCGFIPNYPIIKFAKNSKTPDAPWIDIANARLFFENLILKKTGLLND